MPPSCLPFVYASVSSAEAGSALSGFTEPDFDMSPDVRRIAPFVRESNSVLWTPGFWLRRVNCASVSAGYL
jgi:hypothetical protein